MKRRITIIAVMVLISISTFAQTAYITNLDSNTVSVINVSTNAVINTIHVGTYPFGVSVSLDGSKVYVSNGIPDNSVNVINASTNIVSDTIAVGVGPSGLSVSPDGSKVYVANFNSNSVSVINTSNNTVSSTIPVGTNPFGLCISSDGSKVYVANYSDNTVTVINTLFDTIAATITVGIHPEGICINPNGGNVYVANYGSNTVSVINTTTNSVSATITISNFPSPYGIAISPNGSNVYVSNSNNNSVSVINTTTNSVTATINVGAYPEGISVSPDGSKVYVANNFANTVNVISTTTNIVTNTIPVELVPVAIGNFISTAPHTCSVNFVLYPDTSIAHHYLITDSVMGIAPFQYRWSWGDGNYDSIPNPSHTYADTGIYTICLTITDSTGCQSIYCDSSYNIMRVENMMAYVNVITPFTSGINLKNANRYSVSVYPNPASTILNIHQAGTSGNQELLISDVLGNEVYKGNLAGIDNSINISGWSEGVYFYEVRMVGSGLQILSNGSKIE